MSDSKNSREILLLVTGSIAAYKACHVVSRLVQAGHRVQVAASAAALQFVGAATWEGLSGRPVVSDLWENGHAMDHIHLVRRADLILAAPASAHFVNRIANGIGDDLMTTMFLAHDFKKPFLLAPAMNTSMYLHPATQASIKKLREMGVGILETASGVLACGETGFGKLLEPDLILQEVLKALPAPAAVAAGDAKIPAPREGRVVLITAGGTREKIDDVRFLTNASTGASGARLADRLNRLGFEVRLLKAKSAVQPQDADVKTGTFESFADLEAALHEALRDGRVSHVIHAAAVSDYVVDRATLDGRDVGAGGKMPSGGHLRLELKPTPKLISRLRGMSPRKDLRIAGFKLTSGADAAARESAARKVLESADLVVGNDLREIDDAKERHPYVVYSARGAEPLAGFEEMAARLAAWVTEEGK